MRGTLKPRARQGLALIACAAATTGGVFAAVAASGAAQRGGAITVTGDANGITVNGSEARNVVTVDLASGSNTITISGGTFDDRHSGCEDQPSGIVTCDPRGIELIEAALRDGNDTLAFLGAGLRTLTINGATGPGDDKLLSNKGPQSLKGGKGEDNLNAGPGDDELLGGPQPDVLRGGNGDDSCDDSPRDTSVRGCEN